MRVISLTNSNHKLIYEDPNGDILIELESGIRTVVLPMGLPIHHTNYYLMNLGREIGRVMVPCIAYKDCSREEIETSIKVMIKLKPSYIYDHGLPF